MKQPGDPGFILGLLEGLFTWWFVMILLFPLVTCLEALGVLSGVPS